MRKRHEWFLSLDGGWSGGGWAAVNPQNAGPTGRR